MTNNEAISSVLNGVNISTDDFPVRRRFVFRELKNTRNEFVKQELNKFRLQDDASGQTINCLELERVDASTCYGCDSGIYILKSKHELPELIECDYGLAIINVYLPNGISVNPLSFFDWTNRNGRRNKLPGIYGYAIRNKYLHLLGYEDVDSLFLTVVGHFTNPEDVDKLNLETEEVDSANCIGLGDREFYCPGHISRRVIETTRGVVFRKLGIPLDNSNNSKFDPNEIKNSNNK